MENKKEIKRAVKMDEIGLYRFIEELNRARRGLSVAAKILAESKQDGSGTYQEVCRLRDDVQRVLDGLKPALLL